MSFNFERKEYETRQQKTIDFVIGIGIWIGINVIFAGLQFGLSAALGATSALDNPNLTGVYSVALLICSILPWVVNLGAIIVLAIYRRWMAFGMLSAIGAIMALVICLGIVLVAACGTGLLNNI